MRKTGVLLSLVLILAGISLVNRQVPLAQGAGVQDVNAPSHPVQFGVTVSLVSKGGTNAKVAYTVPAGKRLVIEFVSVIYHSKSSGDFAHAAFSSGGPSFVVPTVSEQGRGSVDFDYVGSELVRVYASARQSVTAQVQHSLLVDPGSVTFAFSGYLLKA